MNTDCVKGSNFHSLFYLSNGVYQCNIEGCGKTFSLADKDKENTFFALLEFDSRCPICYRFMTGANCLKCDNYYLECDCTPMTKEQILDDEE